MIKYFEVFQITALGPFKAGKHNSFVFINNAVYPGIPPPSY